MKAQIHLSECAHDASDDRRVDGEKQRSLFLFLLLYQPRFSHVYFLQLYVGTTVS